MPVPQQQPDLPTSPNAGGASLLVSDDRNGDVGMQLPLGQAGFPFIYKHHPRSWCLGEVDGKPVLLPELARVILEPGCGVVRQRRRDETEESTWHDQIRAIERDGETVIMAKDDVPAACLPSGVPPGKYRRKVQVRDIVSREAGVQYVTAWDIPLPSIPGEPLGFETDRVAFDRWRLHLVSSGAIARPTPQVLREVVDRAVRRADRVKATLWPTNEVKLERVAEAEAELTAARTAAVNSTKPAKPAKASKGDDAGEGKS